MAIFTEVTENIKYVNERGTCMIRCTSTSVLTTVVHMIKLESKIAQGQSKKTDFVFDYFSLNITTEHQKAIKSSFMYQLYTD